MNKTHQLLLWIAVVLSISFFSVSGQAAVPTNPDDGSITAAVNNSLSADPDMKGLDIDVDTDHGAVTLDGYVPTQSLADRAVSIAEKVDNVKSVKSQLHIGKKEAASIELDKLENQAKRGIQKASRTVEDAGITTEINLKFAKDDLVKALSIDVDTTDGFVTLKGTVASQAEADRAVQLSREVEGVKQVRSKLIVQK